MVPGGINAQRINKLIAKGSINFSRNSIIDYIRNCYIARKFSGNANFDITTNGKSINSNW